MTDDGRRMSASVCDSVPSATENADAGWLASRMFAAPLSSFHSPVTTRRRRRAFFLALFFSQLARLLVPRFFSPALSFFDVVSIL